MKIRLGQLEFLKIQHLDLTEKEEKETFNNLEDKIHKLLKNLKELNQHINILIGILDISKSFTILMKIDQIQQQSGDHLNNLIMLAQCNTLETNM